MLLNETFSKLLLSQPKQSVAKLEENFAEYLCWLYIYIHIGLNFLVYEIDFMLFCHLGDIFVLIPVGLDTSF